MDSRIRGHPWTSVGILGHLLKPMQIMEARGNHELPREFRRKCVGNPWRHKPWKPVENNGQHWEAFEMHGISLEIT